MWHIYPFSKQHFLDMGDGVITWCSKWSAFAFTNHQQCLPCSEPQIPLVDTWLGHAFLLVDISHHLYCLFSNLAQFNTKCNICLLFKLWHFATWQCVLIHVAFSLSYTSYCVIIPDHNVPSSCISMCVCLCVWSIPHVSQYMQAVFYVNFNIYWNILTILCTYFPEN